MIVRATPVMSNMVMVLAKAVDFMRLTVSFPKAGRASLMAIGVVMWMKRCDFERPRAVAALSSPASTP